MAADVVVKLEQANSCCLMWKEKYSKLEEKRNALRQAVRLLDQQISKVQAENCNLKKAFEEERARADIEKEGKVKESVVRVSLENEIADLKSEISLLKLKGGSGVQDGDEEIKILQERISEAETEINQLKKLVEKEKIRADSERENAEAEKKKAAEVWKSVKAEKSRTDEGKRFADFDGKGVEEYRLQLEMLKNEADEARSKLVLETSKTKEANERLQAEKQKVIREKKRVDSEKAKVEEQRKLVEANRKKFMEEKCRADNSSRQLEENRQRIEELRKEIHESKRLVEAHARPDKNVCSDIAKLEDRLRLETVKRGAAEAKLVVEFSKSEAATKRLEAEKKKVIGERKRADLEMTKAEDQRKLAEVNRKKVIEEKSRADQLSQQLEEERRRIEELQKNIHELVSSRKLVEASALPPDKNNNPETAKVKLLKEKLKFEKMRVKHAKQVAKFEKARNNILQQELGHLKQEFIQFSHCLDFLDNCFSHGIEGTDDQAKTGNFSNIQRLNLKRKLLGVEPFQMCLRSEHELVKPTCTDMLASDDFRQNIKCTAPSLPTFGGNCSESISGIDSKLESLIRGSDRKMLQSSAINSSTASFSDSQLVGSQERGCFSVTTSPNLTEENLNLQPTISRLSGEVTKTRYNENLAVVAENSVRSPFNNDRVAKVTGNSRKRKRILGVIESIEYLYFEGKKLHLQIEKKLSLLYNMLNRQMDRSFEEGRCLVPNLQGDSYANCDGIHKKGKVSRDQKVVNQLSSDGGEKKKADELDMKGSEDANFCLQAAPLANNLTGSAQACRDLVSDSVLSDQETTVSFEEVADGDYMKLLDLDNAVDEKCYRIAREMPLSPTLPEIEFQSSEVFEVDKSKLLVEDGFYGGLLNGKKNVPPSCSFDVIDAEINSNNSKLTFSGTSLSPLLHKNEGPFDPFENLGNKDNDLCNTVCEGNAFVHQIWNSRAEVEMSNMSGSVNEGAKLQCENELKSQCDSVPEFCVVFSDTKDSGSISKILCATRRCIVQCSLVSHTDWSVQKILQAVAMEDILPKEKACVFFSLLLHNFSGAALRSFGNFLSGDSIRCLDSFVGHIRAVMSDMGTRSLFAESFCLDELLSLIEDFLIDGRVLVYNHLTQTSIISDSRINILLDGVNIILSFETASTDQLVAGSSILASICVAVDEIGFICEASYNIFRTRKFNSSLMLTILHVFAYLCGKKYFTLSNYCLIMTVIKSIVTYLEGANLSVGAVCLPFVSEVQSEYPPCSKCPFSDDAVSVDMIILLLLEMLNYYAAGTMHQDVIESVDSLNSLVLSDKEKSERSSGHEEGRSVPCMNFDVSGWLNKCGMPTTPLDFVINGPLCDFIDVLSLVELVACNMSWEWSYNKIVPQLLKVLESCALENNSAAVVVLLGQLGRLGVDASGYDDTGVENLRCRLSAFLCQQSTMKLGLPIQIATVSALLGLLSLDFESLIQSKPKLPDISSQSVTADLIREWFSLLNKDQQSLSFCFLQSSGVNKNREISHGCGSGSY